MIKNVFLLLLVLTSSNLFASWTWSKFHDDEAVTIYIDKTTVRGEVTKRVWELWNFKKSIGNMQSMLLLREVDCTESKVRTLETVSFRSPDLQGRTVAEDSTTSKWDFLRPDSWQNKIFAEICLPPR